MDSTDWADQKEAREKAALEKHRRLSKLFKEDRFRFELERKEMIADVINSAPDERQREISRFRPQPDCAAPILFLGTLP